MPRLVVRETHVRTARDGDRLRPRLRDADAGLEPRDDLVARPLPRGVASGSTHQRRPERFTNRKGELRRHHADHGARARRWPDRLADDVGRTAVSIAPEIVTKRITGSAPGRSSPSRNPRPRIGCTPSASKAATVSRPPLKRSGRPSSVDRLTGAKPECAESARTSLPRLPDREVLHADRQPRLVLRRVGRHDCDDPVGIREGQSLEKSAVHDAEHGGAQPDPEPEGEDRDDRQRRVLHQHPEPGPDVVEQGHAV